MTRASRTAPQGPFSPFRLVLLLVLGAPLVAAGAEASLQATPGEIVIPPHWSRYQAPTSYPEGTRLHIIVRGDTLWDLSNQYFQNPFLWPQLWDANRYIENPHLIYPGDPLRIPDLEVIRPEGVEAGPGGVPGEPGAPGTEAGEAGPGAPGGPGQPGGGPSGPRFRAAYEEVTIQCAGYLEEDDGDDDFRIFGSEEGDHKIGLATGDILYLNRGTDHGVRAGDMYYTQREQESNFEMRDFIRRTGWVRVLAVQEETALAEVVQACLDIRVGDYLKPFEPIPVPLLPVQDPVTRLTPETGRMRGRIVASLDDLGSMGEGYLVSIDLGQEDGVVPGNVFSVFRYVYDDAPRRVLGELAILTVQGSYATGRIIESYDYIEVGDLVELR
jgi:hypothetical protein